MTEQRLANKVTIVTGAGTRGEVAGTGQAIATVFARHGAKVWIVDRDIDLAEATLATIRAEGGEGAVFQADVTQEAQCKAAVAAVIATDGQLDILVNNVGSTGEGKVTEVEDEYWQRAIDVNLKSAVLMSKHAIPQMGANRGQQYTGAIVNIASIDGIQTGMRPNVPYSVAKGGLITLTKSMAVHHGREQIRVNCIAPGHIYGAFVTFLTAEQREQRRKIAPLGTEGTAWDVAQTALFLASEDARWVSGVVIPVDGGLLAGTAMALVGNLLEE